MRGLIDKIKGSGKETPGQEWRRKVLNYASAINAFVDVGLSEGWDAVGKEPETPKTDHLIKKVVSALKSNQNKKDPEFRELWPPAHGPFASSGFLEKHGQGIPAVSLLEDGTILARIGSTYGEGKVVRITDGDVQPVPDVVLFGACPNKRYYAVIRENRNVDILDGWDGPKITGLNWPTGTEGVPTKYNYSRQEPITCERIMAFPNGRNALLIGTDGRGRV